VSELNNLIEGSNELSSSPTHQLVQLLEINACDIEVRSLENREIAKEVKKAKSNSFMQTLLERSYKN
jgi:hypothetical protein